MPRQILPVAVALGVGAIVLVGLLRLPYVDLVANGLVAWAAYLAGLAVLLGFWNVLTVHVQRIFQFDRHSLVSVVVLSAALITLLATLPEGPGSESGQWVFNNVYRPLEASFLALLAFFIATAAFRSLRAHSIETTLMLLAAVIVLIGQVPLGTFLAPLKEWMLNVPVVAGVRGILLGVALGVIATCLRLLVGIDRPYAE